MITKNPLLEKLLPIILFVFFYVILWIIGDIFLHAWVSPMHWLIPIPGFFLAFFVYNWIEKYFEIKISSWWFPILIIVLAFMAFYVNAWFYYCNGFTDIRTVNTTCDAAGSQKAIEFISTNFWQLFTQDAFFYFWLAALFGWLSKVIWLFVITPEAIRSKPENQK